MSNIQVVNITSLEDAQKLTGNKRNIQVVYTCPLCKKETKQLLCNFLKRNIFVCSKCSTQLHRNKKEIRKKTEDTFLKKYGVKSNLCTLSKERKKSGELLGAANPETKKKMIETNIERYGGDSPFSSKEIRDKAKATLQSKYGVSHNFQIKEFKEKRAQAAIIRNQKYRNSDAYRDFFIEKFIKPKKMTVLSTFLKDNELFYNLKCDCCGDEFCWSIKDRIDGEKQYPYCDRCFHRGASYEEDTLYDFIKSIYNGPIERNTRKELDGKEIDIYLPEKKFGIEYNGLYWHAGDSTRHRKKWEIAQKKGIDLMQIWSCEWDNKRSIIESIIMNRLGLATPIYARKCELKEVPVKEARRFADTYHMQGFYHGLYIGLYYQGELVDMSIYCPVRFGGHYSWELTRHVIKHGVRVIGGLSKELAYFRKTGHHGDIVDYCDMRLFNGKGHWSFEEVGITPPDMQYTDYVRIIPRGKYQKKNMEKIPGFKFDPTKTQLENLHANGMDFIYGVGHKIFVQKEQQAFNSDNTN